MEIVAVSRQEALIAEGERFRRVRAADISDAAMIVAVRACARGPSGWANWDDVTDMLGFPPKVVLAKYRQLEKRKILGGCGCGCLGSFHVLDDMGDGKSYGGPWNGRTR